METAKLIISALGLIGIGGLLKSILDGMAEKKKRKDQSRHELKEVRYKAIIILCYSLINYEKEKNKLIIHRPELTTAEALVNELKVEWMNLTLYASDKVILAMKKFLQDQNEDSLNELVFTMRKSLYDIDSRLTIEDLRLNK